MAIGGIRGIGGYSNKPVIYNNPEATPEQRLGGPYDPRHAQPGETASPYPYEAFPGEQHGPYGLDNQMLGFDICSYTAPAGVMAQDPTGDAQPITRAAPWPKGVPQSNTPDEVAARLSEVQAIRSGGNFGAARAHMIEPTLNAEQDNWIEYADVDAGQSLQVPVPDQLKSQGGTDRVQSFARQNEYGFDSAHLHRRVAAGSIPGNYMWLEPGSRPQVIDPVGTANVPVGADSPFTGQNPRQNYSTEGAVLYDLPVAYQPGPEPATVPGYDASNGAPMVGSFF